MVDLHPASTYDSSTAVGINNVVVIVNGKVSNQVIINTGPPLP
jgi:hypothetical protein